MIKFLFLITFFLIVQSMTVKNSKNFLQTVRQVPPPEPNLERCLKYLTFPSTSNTEFWKGTTKFKV